VTAWRNIWQWLSLWRVAAPEEVSLVNDSMMCLSLNRAGDKERIPLVMWIRAQMCARNVLMLVIQPRSKCRVRGTPGCSSIR
jgi:hypothetical protein